MSRLLRALRARPEGLRQREAETALAARTERASLRSVGFCSNRMLLWGIASELVFRAALVYVPFLQDVFGTAALGATELAILASFALIIWGADELRRARLGRRAA